GEDDPEHRQRERVGRPLPRRDQVRRDLPRESVGHSSDDKVGDDTGRPQHGWDFPPAPAALRLPGLRYCASPYRRSAATLSAGARALHRARALAEMLYSSSGTGGMNGSSAPGFGVRSINPSPSAERSPSPPTRASEYAGWPNSSTRKRGASSEGSILTARYS